MKHAKNCPKCGGDEILKIPGMRPYRRNNGHISCGRTALDDVLLERYVCTKCGYSEEWVNPGEMHMLKEHYG
jgi:ribosomal protein S27AE